MRAEDFFAQVTQARDTMRQLCEDELAGAGAASRAWAGIAVGTGRWFGRIVGHCLSGSLPPQKEIWVLKGRFT